jgi:Fuc2NAc and GlcNAc transferase
MFIFIFFSSFFLGGLGAWFIKVLGSRFGLLDRPNERSSHQKPTPKGGGIGILAAFLFASLVFEIPKLFWIPAASLALLSFFSDKLELSAKVRLAFQFLAAIVLLFGTRYSHIAQPTELILIIFLAIFVVGTANIYNFMDGINGIAAITGIVGFGFLGFTNFLSGGEKPFTILPICTSLSCLGFLPFNMPKAKVFMGDVGSILLGFVFAGTVVLLSKNFLDFVCLASFLFPFYADELTTMIVRLKARENLLRPHRKHLYQLLANEKRISHWKVSVGCGLVQLAVGLTVLFLKPYGIIVILSSLLAYFVAFILASSAVRKNLAPSS